ncbi:hypothetical protein V5O48_005647 [Marasmius crinis-equi]|uniref:LysM domain-containing protein n=1 Tax=Marasmius crinis-equi TaxID=585013 RepID=A0ABR3FLQ2_9AGAR
MDRIQIGLATMQKLRRRGADLRLSNDNPLLLAVAALRAVALASFLGHTISFGPEVSSGFADSGVTRPHLNRVLTSKLIDLEGEDETMENVEIEVGEEKEVLVHKVAQRDSLAGVALKYGITIGDLRRANHLWASDSIHLREELYIPLDKASRRQTETDGQAANIRSQSPKDCNRDTLIDDTIPGDHPDAPTPTIRKIPTKHLSFFPPPAKRPATDARERASLELPHESNNHSWTATTPSTSLNTILTALPIPASTRDSIMARLSFDSSSSSFSDQDHELDDVRVGRHARSLSHDSVIDGYDTARIVRRSRPGVLRKAHGRPESSAIKLDNLPHHDTPAYPLSSPNRSSASPDITSPIPVRTVQMEPSPTMHLPSPKKEPRSKTLGANDASRRGKSRPKLIDIEFDSNVSASAPEHG